MATISPLIFGWMIWQNQSVYTVYALKDLIQQHFPAGHKMFWILGTGGDDAADWRWDDNSHSSADASSLSQIINESVTVGNTLDNPIWGDSRFATDMSRYYRVIKTSGNADAYGRAFLNGAGEALPLYLRFDVGISSVVTFSVTDPWKVCRVEDTAQADIYTVQLTNSREIKVVQGANSITSPAMSLDTMYSVEVKMTSTEIELWMQPSGTAPVSRGTIAGSFPAIRRVQFGAYQSSVCQGEIYLDAIRMDSSFVGSPVAMPWNRTFIMHVTGDHAWKNYDELAKLTESVGGEIFWRIKMHNTSTVLTNTQQFWDDFISYMFGTATTPQDESNFDMTHLTPGQNWANLRYFRGRQAPWTHRTIIIGAEPYFLESYARTVAGATDYANDFVTRVNGLKAINSAIKCLSHADSNQAAAGPWENVTLPIIKDLVNGQDCFHNYIRVPGSNEAPQLHWLTGGWDADENTDPFSAAGKAGKDQHACYVDLARDKFAALAPSAPGKMLGISEWGYQISIAPGSGNHLGWALMRASHLVRAIKDDYDYLGHWLYTSESGQSEGIVSVKDNGSVELTPSFYLYKIASRLANHTKINLTLRQSYKSKGTMQGFSYHPLSVVGGRLLNIVRLFVVNRTNRRVRAKIAFTLLGNFTIPGTGTLIKIGGGAHTWMNHNATDPNNVIDAPSTIGVSNPMTHTFEPYSINMMEITSL